MEIAAPGERASARRRLALRLRDLRQRLGAALFTFIAGRGVDVLAALSLLITLVIALAGFPSGTAGRLTSLLYDLALATDAAWVFNLFLVVLPRRRERARAYALFGTTIRRVAVTGRDMLGYLGACTSGALEPADPWGDPAPDRAIVTRVTAKLAPHEAYELFGSYTATPWEIVCREVAKARGYRGSLQPWLASFDPDLVDALDAVAFSELSQIAEDWPHVDFVTLADVDEAIYRYWAASRGLFEVHERRVKPMSDPAWP